MPQIPMDDHQDRAEAGKKPDTKSKTSFNQRKSKNQPETGRKPEAGLMDHQSPERQMTELRDERDRGYGSEYIGNEYSDVKVDEIEKDGGNDKAA
jgi:hypothetical protein